MIGSPFTCSRCASDCPSEWGVYSNGGDGPAVCLRCLELEELGHDAPYGPVVL